MTAAVVTLAAVVGAAVGGMLALAWAAIRRADTSGDERTARARAEGERDAAIARAELANAATAEANAAVYRLERVAAELEEELSRVETYPIAPGDPAAPDPGDRPGRQRLRRALASIAGVRAVPASGDPAGVASGELPARPAAGGAAAGDRPGER